MPLKQWYLAGRRAQSQSITSHHITSRITAHDRAGTTVITYRILQGREGALSLADTGCSSVWFVHAQPQRRQEAQQVQLVIEDAPGARHNIERLLIAAVWVPRRYRGERAAQRGLLLLLLTVGADTEAARP
jgi:hypothetical protein